jgi:hypothetical protein
MPWSHVDGLASGEQAGDPNSRSVAVEIDGSASHIRKADPRRR